MRAAPAVSRAKCNIEDAHEHTGSAEAIRPSLHGGLRLTSCSPRRPGSFATVTPEKLASQELDTSVGVSGPHDFAVRIGIARQARIRVHRIPPRVCDVASRPSEWDRAAGDIGLSRGKREAESFYNGGWTGFGDLPDGQIKQPVTQQ